MAMPFPSPNTPPDGDNHHPSVLDKLFSSAGPHLAPRLQHAQSKLTAHSYGAQLDTALRSSSSSLGARARRVSGRLDALHAGWGGAVEAAADKYASKLAGAGIEARVDSVAKRVGEALGSVEHRLGYGQAQQQQHHQQQQQQQPDPPVFPPPPGTPARQQQQRPEPQQQQQQLGAAAGAGAGAVGAGAHDPPRSPRIELVEPRVGPAQQFDSPPGSPPRAPLGLKHGQQHPPEPAPAPTQSTHGTPLQPPAQPAPSAPSPSVLAPHLSAPPPQTSKDASPATTVTALSPRPTSSPGSTPTVRPLYTPSPALPTLQSCMSPTPSSLPPRPPTPTPPATPADLPSTPPPRPRSKSVVVGDSRAGPPPPQLRSWTSNPALKTLPPRTRPAFPISPDPLWSPMSPEEPITPWWAA
ncbi:hypothetical protein Q8F55_004106 [Vanrija albida]|uniref:Uncharacterized protein n=1 Tax=Vanrija albida TaxID=181172 RepID=A0ABR3Q6Y3_9TREE